MSLVRIAFPVPVVMAAVSPIPAICFAAGAAPQAGISIHRPADSTTAVMPVSLIRRDLSSCIALGPFLDSVDVVGHQSVGLPVDVGRGPCRRRLDQAEHPPISF